MTKIYDASQEFKPFANRGLGGALLEERKYNGHPNKDGYRAWAGKPNKSQHRPNRRVRVCEVSSQPFRGYSYVKA